MIKSQYMNDYTDALKEVKKRATTDLNILWGSALSMSESDLVEFLKNTMPMLTEKYGDIAATVAAEFYESVRADQVNGKYTAILANTVPEEQVNSSIRYASRHIYDGEKAKALGYLIGALGKFVLQPARDTIKQNGVRDPAQPRFARIPYGKTCAWCLMLAGRGFVYHDRDKAGGDILHGSEFDRYHAHCDCQVVMDFTNEPSLEGYNSTSYEDMYYAAREKAHSGDQHDIVAMMRRLFPDVVRDGVHT